MICNNCGHKLKEYTGFNMASSGEWDCINKDCTPKAEKPTISDELCGGDLYAYYHLSGGYLSCEDCGKVYSGDDALACDYECIIPTRSTPGQTAAGSQAKPASSQPRHTRKTPVLGVPAQANALPLPAPYLDLDDSDQCTLQQQESDLPRGLDTPRKAQYGSMACMKKA